MNEIGRLISLIELVFIDRLSGSEWPLLAESGPSKFPKFIHPNDRFREKRTLASADQLYALYRKPLAN